MSKFSKAMRATNAVASLIIAIGVAVDLYEKFKGRKKTQGWNSLVLPVKCESELDIVSFIAFLLIFLDFFSDSQHFNCEKIGNY